MQQFTDKVAIITGGASGIGRALGQELVKSGAKVIVADINIASVDNDVQAVQVDVSQADQVQNLVDHVVREHGRLDYMFNNAGFAIGGELRDMNLEQWNRILDVNLKGVIHGVLAAYPVMIKQGYGHIINTASLAGLAPTPVLGAYSTTKHAVVGLSNALRVEGAGLGVKVTALCPGFIQTNIFDSGIYLKSTQSEVQSTIPFKNLPIEKAAPLLLRGVLKNQAIVTMPAYAHILWRLYRLSPAIAELLNRKTINDFRKVRK